MNASDLQVGDLVTNNGDVIKVSAVHTKKIGYHKTKNKLNWLFSGQLEPISLTPEILEKNCFYSVNECIFETPISEEDLIRLIHVDKGWIVDAQIYAKVVNIGYGYFKYVHELQHALKLCGIEKEIVV